MKKILLSLLCFCLLLSAVACTKESANSANTEGESKAMTTSDGSGESEDPPRNTDPEAIKRIYDDVITDYKTLLTAKKNGEELPMLTTKTMNQRERAIAEALYGIVDACKDGGTAPVPTSQIIYNQAIIDGIVRSANCGREVEINVPEI